MTPDVLSWHPVVSAQNVDKQVQVCGVLNILFGKKRQVATCFPASEEPSSTVVGSSPRGHSRHRPPGERLGRRTAKWPPVPAGTLPKELGLLWVSTAGPTASTKRVATRLTQLWAQPELGSREAIRFRTRGGEGHLWRPGHGASVSPVQNELSRAECTGRHPRCRWAGSPYGCPLVTGTTVFREILPDFLPTLTLWSRSAVLRAETQ